jgi:hypothetical protein
MGMKQQSLPPWVLRADTPHESAARNLGMPSQAQMIIIALASLNV